MNVEIDGRWETMLREAVGSGRFASTTDVIDKSLELMAAREEQLAWLRAKVQASIARGGELSAAEVDAHLEQTVRELQAEGYE